MAKWHYNGTEDNNLEVPLTFIKTLPIFQLYLLQRLLPEKKWCRGYDTKLHQMVRLQGWNPGESGIPLHYSQAHTDPE